MPYIGSTPTTQNFISGTDYFNGTGAQTAFTLTRTVNSVNDIQVVVNNVVQQPNDAYTLSGTTLTFTSAPSSGTNNVYVRYLSTTLQSITPSYGSIIPSMLNPPNTIYWDTTQNVGIGTTTITSSAGWSPRLVLAGTDTALIVKGVSGQENSFGASGGLYIDCLGNSTGTNNNIIFRNTSTNSSYSASERMRITSSGNVGIGVTPSAWGTNTALQIHSASFWGVSGALTFASVGANYYWDGAVYRYISTERATDYYQSNGIHAWRTAASGTAGNTITFTESMRITSAGDVCINRTSSLGSAKLHVTNAAGDANNWVVSLKTNATSVATTMIAFYDGSEDFCGQIYVDPVANTTVYSTSSDYRLKDNVVPMTGALAKVQALNPVTYTWKKSGKTGQGFIAHELQEIVPECVVGEKDAMRTYTDEEGNEQTAILPQMVDTSFLVATLTKAIQEQQAMIEELKARIETLEAK